MKIILTIAFILIASFAFASGSGDTIYNSRGQGVQTEAPNYFETFADSLAKHTINFSTAPGTLYWQLYAPTGCTFAVTATSSTAGAVWHTIPSGSRDGMGVGYGMVFGHYTSCPLGQFRSMKGDWRQGNE